MKNILLLFICFQTVMTAQSGQKNFIDQPYIEVNGNATLEITPDEIYISIILQETNRNLKNAIEAQEKKLITHLKKANINVKENLKVKDFTTNYKNYFLYKTDVQKTKEFELLVTSGKELSTVYRILEQLRIADSYIIRVDHSNIENLKLEANIKAISNAKNKCTSYSKALGQKTGKAIYIQEQAQLVQNFYPLYQRQRTLSIMNVSPDQEQPVSEFKNIIIKANVLVRFTLL